MTPHDDVGAYLLGALDDAEMTRFEEHLAEIPSGGRRLFVFLGSTIGNLTPEPRAEFLATLSGVMVPGDSLLLGTDLVKDVGRLVRAYDDSAGVTAKFNRNVLAVVNRELDADFDLDAFVLRLSRPLDGKVDIESIASLAAHKPAKDWSDADLDRARVEIVAFAQRFVRLEALAIVNGRRPKRHAMAVVVHGGGRYWLGVSGMTWLEIPEPAPT